jgi:hypothetical protein
MPASFARTDGRETERAGLDRKRYGETGTRRFQVTRSGKVAHHIPHRQEFAKYLREKLRCQRRIVGQSWIRQARTRRKLSTCFCVEFFDFLRSRVVIPAVEKQYVAVPNGI